VATGIRNLPEAPTAVFAVNDHSARNLVRGARASGIAIPEELSVVGFDNAERWSVAPAFITTISQPFDEIGEEAVQLMRERLERPVEPTGMGGSYREVLLHASLVVRGSSGPPRSDPDRG
jgi:DNA-binding LacI/PurR family transcriptional regulator